MNEKDSFMSNFAIMIPQTATVIPKPKRVSKWKRFLCATIGHTWGFAGITYMGPSFPRKCSRCKMTKWFDKPTLRMRFAKWVNVILDKYWPMCMVGLHLWKSHYGFSTFSYGGNGPYKEINQHIYKCSCCKKIKTVNL